MKAIACLALALAACASAPPVVSEAPPTEQQLQELALALSFIPGTFETFAEPNVQSDSTPVRIRHARFWPERRNEGWIYVEYAYANDDAHPFRQRIYRLRPAPGSPGVVLTVFGLPGAAQSYAGEWRKARPFEAIAPGDLREVPGCSIVLERQMEMVLAGGTSGAGCHALFSDADHDHWEFQFTSSSLRLWEMGVDANGRRVAGPGGAWETRRMAREAR
jgi:hypothetical protein